MNIFLDFLQGLRLKPLHRFLQESFRECLPKFFLGFLPVVIQKIFLRIPLFPGFVLEFLKEISKGSHLDFFLLILFWFFPKECSQYIPIYSIYFFFRKYPSITPKVFLAIPSWNISRILPRVYPEVIVPISHKILPRIRFGFWQRFHRNWNSSNDFCQRFLEFTRYHHISDFSGIFPKIWNFRELFKYIS